MGAGELAEQEAAIWQGEDGTRLSLTWRELSDEVFRLAEGLASIGIGEGDAVGIFLPMSPQVAIASHACAHLGAVQVPIFSGFAPPAIAARLADAKAKALITADGSLRRGQIVPMKQIADEALAIGTDGDAHGRLAAARARRRADDDRPRPLLGRARRERRPGI